MAKLTPEQRVTAAYDAERRYGLPKGMLVAQLNTESSNGKNNYNASTGATGPMQFMPATAKDYGIDPNDDNQAIDGAGRYMAKNLKDAKGVPAHALELYYAGSEKGIGKNSRAYPVTVASKWNPDDAFEAAMGGNTQASAEPAPVAAAPATDAAPDFDTTFEKAMTPATAPDAPAPTAAAPQEPPEIAALKIGMKKVAAATHDPDRVRQFVIDSGYDPSKIENLEPWAKGGRMEFGATFAPERLPATTENALSAGFHRGLNDVNGTLNNFAAYMDRGHPMLEAIDNAVGSGGNQLQASADAFKLDRDAYNQNYGTFASGLGRFGGNALGVGLLSAPIASGLGAVAAGDAAASPVASFMLGKGGTNMLGRVASMSATGAAAGGAGNLLTSSASNESPGQYALEGAKIGAVAGPVIGGIGAGARALVRKVAPALDEGTAKLAQVARDKYGIDLRGSQITNSPIVRRMDGQLSTSLTSNTVAHDAAQRGQFTRAVGRTFGADAPELTPQVMEAAKKRIGGVMDGVASRTNIPADDELLGDLGEIEHSASQSMPDNVYAPIKRQLDDIVSSAGKNGDVITGEMYQRLTAKGGALDKAMSSGDPNIRQSAMDIRGALDDALERHASPEDLQALRQARLQYKNMKTVEPLISKDAGNQISHALLNNRVSVNFKNRAYQGAGDLDELAQIGQRFLKPPSSSGTAENIKAQKMMDGGNALAGIGLGALGHSVGVPMGADILGGTLMAGRGAIGAGKNAILSRVLASDAYRNALLGKALHSDVSPAINFPKPYPMILSNRLLNMTTQPTPQSR